jgi:HK97 family phage major capsid protein
MKDTILRLATQQREIYDRANAEGRRLTTEESIEVADLLAAAESLKNTQTLSKALGPASQGGSGFFEPGSFAGGGPGDAFIASEGYKSIKSPDTRQQQWSSGMVEVSRAPLEMKGTLLESGVGGPGGGLVPPAYQPGIVSKLFEPLGVSDLFGSSQTTASQMRYVVEGTATSGAAGVAEGAAKPESTMAYSETVEAIRKIATVLPVSDEMLEDAPSIQSYLNSRLSLFVKIEEEEQLLRGAGSGSNELLGIFGRSGINTYTKLAADDNATALAKVLANTRGSANVMPDAIIMHPTNWLNTRLLRDGTGGTIGQFFGGGPFTGAYGVGNGAALFGESLWNTRVALSTVVGLGTALVGNFSTAAHVWRRGGVSVEATNSHSDYFVKNLSMLRAEERLGLGVYRPVAFTAVSGLA